MRVMGDKLRNNVYASISNGWEFLIQEGFQMCQTTAEIENRYGSNMPMPSECMEASFLQSLRPTYSGWTVTKFLECGLINWDNILD